MGRGEPLRSRALRVAQACRRAGTPRGLGVDPPPPRGGRATRYSPTRHTRPSRSGSPRLDASPMTRDAEMHRLVADCRESRRRFRAAAGALSRAPAAAKLEVLLAFQ